MRTNSETFKTNIRTHGRQIDVKIMVNEELKDTDNFCNLRYNYNTALFKTIMQGFEIETKEKFEKNATYDISVGVKVDSEPYEYVDFTRFYQHSIEKLEDYNAYKATCYDKIVESMVDYDLKVEYPISLRDYLIAIFNRLNWDISGIPETFVNSTKMINRDIHSGISYTFRDVLDEICTICGAFLIAKNDIPTLCYPTETEVIIDESYLKDNNVTIKEKCFFNSLVFSRVLDADSICRQDEASITQNGINELKISNNQILSTNDRVDFIDELWEYIKDYEYYVFDVNTIGILFLEPIDMFNFNINGVTYPTLILNDEVSIEDGLEEIIYSEHPDETVTEYKYVSNSDKEKNKTYITVDKQLQEINATVNKVTSTLDYIREASNPMPTKTIKSNNNIHIEDARNKNALEYIIEGMCEQEEPSIDNPKEIKSVGYQNFFDHNYFFENYVMYENSTVGRCVYQLEPNTNYSVSTNIDIGTSAAVFVVSGNNTDFTPSTDSNGVLSTNYQTVTTDSNGHLIIGMHVTSDNAQTLENFENGTAKIQITKGDYIYEYIPFSKYGIEIKINSSETKLIVLDEPLSGISDIKDTYNLTTGILTKRIGKVVLNGSENWGTNVDYQFYLTDYNQIFAPLSPIVSSHFINCEYWAETDGMFVASTGNIGMTNTKTQRLADLKTWLSENPVTVYYVLTNEETVELTPVDIELQKGINNISLLSNVDATTSLLYYQDREKDNNLLLENTPKSHGAINKLRIKNFYHHKLYPNMTYPSEYTYPNILNFYTLIFSNEEIKYSVNLPVASAELENKVYNTQAIGGKYYRCVNNEGTYEWIEATDIEIQEVYINSPVPLNTVVKDGVLYSDEIFIEENNVKIIQNIGLVNNEWEPLSSPIIHELDTLTLPTFETDTYITLKYFDDLDYYAMYLIKNDLTSIFSTQAETLAQLQILSNNISLTVSDITSELEAKIELKVDSANLVSELNASADIIRLKGNRISIESDYFTLTEDGKVTATGATIKGIFETYSSSTGFLAAKFANHGLYLYDWENEGLLSGRVTAMYSSSTKKRGITMITTATGVLSLGNESAEDESVTDVCFQWNANTPDKTPWIKNTANGTLFDDNPNGGVIIENGLIKSWNLDVANGTLFPDNPSGGIEIADGLIVNWSLTGCDGTITLANGSALTFSNGLLVRVD